MITQARERVRKAQTSAEPGVLMRRSGKRITSFSRSSETRQRIPGSPAAGDAELFGRGQAYHPMRASKHTKAGKGDRCKLA